MQCLADRRALELQPHRPHEVEHLLDDGVGHLRFVDDVLDQRLRVGIVGHLTAQQPGHHFDARQRVLDLVRHRRGHLAERGQSIAQPLALFHLLDVRQVLEEERRAGGLVVLIANERQRVADHLVARLQPELRAVGQRGELEGAVQHTHDFGVTAEDIDERLTEVIEIGGEVENSTRFVVDQHQAAGPIDRQHAVAHIGNHVAKELIGYASGMGARSGGGGTRTPKRSHGRHWTCRVVANPVPHR